MGRSAGTDHKRVTATDVARVAGVSQATVSYVLNNVTEQKIPPETRQRVLDAAAALRYTPNSAARALRKGRSDTVLVLVHNIRLGPALAQILDLLTDELDKRGFSLTQRKVREGRSIESLWRDVMPAAIVGIARIPPEDVAAIRAAGIFFIDPMVRSRDNVDYHVPQDGMAALQAEHLIERGHRRLGYGAAGDPRNIAEQHIRCRGVAAVCRRHGLSPPVAIDFALDLDSAVQALKQWMACEPPVTGICTMNDEHAIALLAAARKLKIKVPGQVAIIGLANLAAAPFTHPPLTTIRIHDEVVCANTAEAIAAGVKGEKRKPRQGEVLFSLLVRQST